MIRLIHIVLSLFFLLNINNLCAQENRSFNQEKLEEYRGEKRYQYDRNIEERDSIVGKVFRAIGKFFETAIGAIIGYALLIIIFILIVLLIIRSNSVGFKKEVQISYPDIHEPIDLYREDWGEMLKNALSSGDHRLSVRYLYLISLKLLDEKKLVSWNKKKTNHEIIEEIESFEKQSAFRHLTYVFEYTWYGKFKIDNEKFSLVKTQFENFNSEIKI